MKIEKRTVTIKELAEELEPRLGRAFDSAHARGDEELAQLLWDAMSVTGVIREHEIEGLVRRTSPPPKKGF